MEEYFKTELGTLYLGSIEEDLGEYIKDKSVDLVCTDPPYPKEYLHLYTRLGQESKRILRRGGSLLTLAGQSHLPFVINTLSEYLKYRWIIHYDHWEGSHSRMLMGIEVTWKPYLWFVNEVLSPNKNIVDTCKSLIREKYLHKWQQSEGYAAFAIENLTEENQLVVDPFAGSGTTLLVAEKLNRKWVGIEISEVTCQIIKDRFNANKD